MCPHRSSHKTGKTSTLTDVGQPWGNVDLAGVAGLNGMACHVTGMTQLTLSIEIQAMMADIALKASSTRVTNGGGLASKVRRTGVVSVGLGSVKIDTEDYNWPKF
jgi:hypothetical protein